jgi:type 1 glutamine amidotransferase
MDLSLSRRAFQAGASVALAVPVNTLLASPPPDSKPRSIRIVVGPSKHPPGTHEVQATGRLLKDCLERSLSQLQITDTAIDLSGDWPTEKSELDRIASLVFVGDFFPPVRMEGTAKILDDIDSMTKRGCGLICVHYATGLGAKDVAEDGDHPLLRWLGGYFATRCVHHQSVAKIFEAATIQPTQVEHPILNGWKPFTIHDEPYIENYFGKNGLLPGVTILATSELPPEAPKTQAVVWSIERPYGGRGVGVVMPHFYRNWTQPDLRKMLLNAILWSSKIEIPKQGIDITLDNLAQFSPDSIEPVAKKS